MLHRAGLRQVEAPAKMMPRQHGDSSITPLRSIYYMLKVILAILINLLRRPRTSSPSRRRSRLPLGTGRAARRKPPFH